MVHYEVSRQDILMVQLIPKADGRYNKDDGFSVSLPAAVALRLWTISQDGRN